MNILTRKVEPALPNVPQTRPSTPAALAWLDEYETMKQDNAYLRDELERVKNDLKVEQEMNRRITAENGDLRDQRDFLQRHDTAMMSHLHNIKLLIVSAEESARATAFAPPGSGVDATAERTAEAQEKIDQAAAEVAKMLAPNPVATDAAIRAMEVPGNA